MIKLKNLSNQSKLLIVVLFVALFLRLLGVWHDYPFSFYSDEITFVKRALAFGSFDFNPHWFHKPAFYMYILFFEYGFYFLFGKIIGLWDSTLDFAVSYILNPGPFYIIGRLTTVFFSVASIVVVYLTGEKHFAKNTGLIAALLLTLCFGHVVSSQAVKADIPAAFFSILSMYFLLNYFKDTNPVSLLLSAAVAGIGTATKVYPVVMMVPIIICIFFICKREMDNRVLLNSIKWALLAFIAFCVMYFVCSPYNFLDPIGRQQSIFANVIRILEKILSLFSSHDIVNENTAKFISEPLSFSDGVKSYLHLLIDRKGMGMLIGGLGLAGVMFLLSRFQVKYLLFLIFPIAFFLISTGDQPGNANIRHQMPVYPFLAIAGGAFFVYLAGKGKTRQRVVYGLLIVGLCIPLIAILQHGILVSKQDTRNIAKIWIENNISPGTKVLVTDNGPPLFRGEDSLLQSLEEAENHKGTGQFTTHYGKYLKYQLIAAQKTVTYDITEIRFPWWIESEKETGAGAKNLTSELDQDMGNPLRKMGVNSYQYYLDKGYVYAIVHSYRYATYFLPNSNSARKFPSFKKFYTDLFNNGELIQEFSSKNGDYVGPVVKIYKFKAGQELTLRAPTTRPVFNIENS